MTRPAKPNGIHTQLHHIPLSYNNDFSEKSALTLIFSLRPEWEHSEGTLEIVRFKDGITNTVGFMKVGMPKEQD
jgi:ethanolamine kinase